MCLFNKNQPFAGPLPNPGSGLDAPLFALQQLLGPKCKVKYLQLDQYRLGLLQLFDDEFHCVIVS